MSVQLLNERIEGDTIVKEYTKNGETISHTVMFPTYPEIPIEDIPIVDVQLSVEEVQQQILLNTELLIIYKELGF